MFSADCPVCRKSLFSGIRRQHLPLQGLRHGGARQLSRACKGIFKCVPLKKHSDAVTGEALSDKLMRSIKKDHLNLYDQPIGYLYT